ncbi:XkdQ/YqbQ family protein [Cohnella abietis]|uniref:YqbQ/XkdQ domain-containing protein n=1 Tax=Cohnella abietis TaxID=2507935 RepID=A0A3T1D367_9BACL|nr:hypothetical protein [Cohnella abietis]BBI32491.1 hypothetical protein KCTCHS21_18900 [Cohnella abietis]
MFKLILVKNDGQKSYDVTALCAAISWDDNLSLMSAMQFEIAFSDAKLIPTNPCDLGDAAILYDNEVEVYRGIIVTEGRSGRDTIKYTVYDYAWYLGKSKSVYQFNKITASQAITRILNDFGMLIGHVPQMLTPINDIFLEKSPAEIIEDIYKREERRTGKRFNVEMRSGRIYFEDMKDLVIKGTFRLADNQKLQDVMDNPLAAERTRSIESMRNVVKILVERKENKKKKKDQPDPKPPTDQTDPKSQKSQTSYDIVAITKDEPLIRKYGLLEEVYKIDAEDAAKAREVARILLKRLARIQETNSIKLIGDSSFKAGRLLDIDEPITGMSGRFMIVTAKHTVTNQIHIMDLELALPEDVK